MGARHNHCHTGDTVMGRPMGVHDMQYTNYHGKSEAVANYGHRYSLPFS